MKDSRNVWEEMTKVGRNGIYLQRVGRDAKE